MANKNNIIKEIQELIQQFKNEYQEGIDYESASGSEFAEKHGVEHIRILSPRLRQYCREKFHFPFGVNDHLHYYKQDEEGAIFYRTAKNPEGEYFWWYDRQKAGHDIKKGEKKPKKCAVCNKLAFKKDGRMKLWNGEVTYISYDNVWKPSPVAYFHPECSPKYFADKHQPNEKSIQTKEKLLRNLDKISLDYLGYLANAELMKENEVENISPKGGNDPIWNAWNEKVHQVKIEDEEINLTELEGEVKLAVQKAIIQGIKQNPQDWKIENSTIYAQPSQNIPDSFKILKHKSGRRHWNVGIIHLNENLERGKRDWAEIEALINGSPLPVKNQTTTDAEFAKLKTIFQKLDIKEISFENGELVITHNNNNEIITNNQLTNNSEYQTIADYCQKHHERKITKGQLGIGSDTNSTNSKPNDHKLVIGLAVGIIGGVALTGIIVFLLSRKRKNK